MFRKWFTGLVVILILCAQALFTVTPVQAAAITVTSKLDTPDPGKCRLRDAITAANTNTATGSCPAGTAGPDTIGFSLGIQCSLTPCTITLTGALPTVTEDLTINGNNATVSGANAFRVFDLGAVTVTISNLRIANGSVSSNNGGAINMSNVMPGTNLNVTNVSFSGNHADNGGAIFEPRGGLAVVNSNFNGNTAAFGGGAICEERSGSLLTVDNSIFNNNTALDEGGAILILSTAFISRSTFSGNSATVGGAIDKDVLGDLHINDSVINSNVATTLALGGNGGGIAFSQNVGTATLTNVTLSGNTAKNWGGGIFASFGTLNLNNVTITGNIADSDFDGIGDGGGIFRINATVQIQNSIIAGNFDTPGNAGGGTKNPDCSGTFSSQGYNLIGRNDGCSGFVNGINGDKVGSGASPIDPLLDALANNGGPTLTHALLPGSPAMNAGNPLPPGSGGFACTGTDQRGITRPQGSACDIGAFEFEFRSLYLPLISR